MLYISYKLVFATQIYDIDKFENIYINIVTLILKFKVKHDLQHFTLKYLVVYMI